MDAKDALLRWAERFWFLRGVAAAILLAQFVPLVIDTTRFKFLRAFHALLVGWDSFAAWVGTLIGEIPFLPTLSATSVNAGLFALSIGFPGAYAMRKDMVDFTSSLGGVRYIFHGFVVPLIVIFLTGLAYFYIVNLEEAVASGWLLLMLVLSLVLVASAFVLAVSLKGYAKGMFVVVTFIIAMQVLYYLSTPGLAEAMDRAADSVLGPADAAP